MHIEAWRARCCRSRTEKVWNFHFADHCFCSSFAHDKPLFSPCFDTSKAALNQTRIFLLRMLVRQGDHATIHLQPLALRLSLN